MDSGWVSAATINKIAPVSQSALINSASDVFLCVYLTSEKELEDKRFPPEQKQRIYHANKTRLNRTADCHYGLEALGTSYTLQAERSSNFGSTTSRDRKLSVLYSARTDCGTRQASYSGCRLRLKCDGTRAETTFRLSAKRTSPFKSAGASVQSTTGSRGVRISFYCW